MNNEKDSGFKLNKMLMDGDAFFTNPITGQAIKPSAYDVNRLKERAKERKLPIKDSLLERVLRHQYIPKQLAMQDYVRLSFKDDEKGYQLFKNSIDTYRFIEGLEHFIGIEPGSKYTLPRFGEFKIHVDLDLEEINKRYDFSYSQKREELVPQLEGFDRDFEGMLYFGAVIMPGGFPSGDDIWDKSADIYATRMLCTDSTLMIGRKEQLDRYTNAKRYREVPEFEEYKEELYKTSSIFKINPNDKILVWEQSQRF